MNKAGFLFLLQCIYLVVSVYKEIVKSSKTNFTFKDDGYCKTDFASFKKNIASFTHSNVSLQLGMGSTIF